MTSPSRRDRRWIALVLAAGKGTRMRSDLAKVLHELRGKTLLAHVLDTAARLPLGRTIVVVGHQGDEVRERHAGFPIETVLQEPQLGTGHAVMVAESLLRAEPEETDLLVLYGDVPLLRETTLLELMEQHRLEGNGVTVLSARVPDPKGYGRIIRDPEGRFLRIREDRDLTEEQRSINEINSGIYAFRLKLLLESLGHLENDNAQKEYYLTDTLEMIRQSGSPAGVFCLGDPEEISGINTVAQLGEAEAVLDRRETDPGSGCRVCRILRERPDLILLRRDGLAVFLDPEPYNSGHLRIATERHLVSDESLSPEETERLWSLAQEAELWCDETYRPQGMNLGYNSGRSGEHLSLHVIPRWAGDSNFMPLVGGVNILPETLDRTRRRLLETMERLREGGAGTRTP